jgi:hypothetical protein
LRPIRRPCAGISRQHSAAAIPEPPCHRCTPNSTVLHESPTQRRLAAAVGLTRPPLAPSASEQTEATRLGTFKLRQAQVSGCGRSEHAATRRSSSLRAEGIDRWHFVARLY